MKKISLTGAFILILVTGVLMTGCGPAIIKKDAGPSTTREYDFTGFTSIEIGDAFKLEVIPGDEYGISISASENVFEHISVSQTGEKLKIDLDYMIFNFARAARVKITMPELRGLYMSGASEGSAAGFRTTRDFDLSLSGASELVMDMETGDFKCELSGASKVAGYLGAAKSDVSLSGASTIDINGYGGNVIIDGSGASRIDFDNFTVDDVDISLSGACDASLETNGKLDVTLSGASSLKYTGNPALGRLDISGGSDLKHRATK